VNDYLALQVALLTKHVRHLTQKTLCSRRVLVKLVNVTHQHFSEERVFLTKI